MINIDAYMRYMGIKSFPHFYIEYFKPDIKLKYTSVAQSDYKSGKHVLRLPSNYKIPRPLLYHELTHIYDMEMLKNGEEIHDFCLNGYMEYHASQVELMVGLGANSIKDTLSFSVRDPIDNLGFTIKEYMDTKFEIAVDMLNNSIPNNRLDGLGVLYNFLGLKSICLMYALDYKDNYNYCLLTNRLGPYLLSTANRFMVGWEIDVSKAVGLYSNCMNAIL